MSNLIAIDNPIESIEIGNRISILSIQHDADPPYLELDNILIGSSIDTVIGSVFQDRVRWEMPFDPENPQKLCWSNFGVEPHPNGDMFGKVKNCSECPHSKWDNSRGKNKGKKPSCTSQINFLGLIADPNHIMYGKSFLLRAKNTSSKAATDYLLPFVEAQRLSKKTGREPKLCLQTTLTKISVVPANYGKSKIYGKLTFSSAELSSDVSNDLNIQEFIDNEVASFLASRLDMHDDEEEKNRENPNDAIDVQSVKLSDDINVKPLEEVAF